MMQKGRGLLALLLALCLLLPLMGLAEDANEAIYQRAVKLQEDGEYDSAISVFGLLKDYKDSPARLEESLQAKNGQVYEVGLKYLAEGQHDTAISVFSLILDYKDSRLKIEEAKTGKLQLQYDGAMAQAKAGNYHQAKLSFLALDGFADSALQALQMDKNIQRDTLMLEARSLDSKDPHLAYKRLETLLEDPEQLLRPEDKQELNALKDKLVAPTVQQLIGSDLNQAAAFMAQLEEEEAKRLLMKQSDLDTAYALQQLLINEKPDWAGLKAVEPELVKGLAEAALKKGDAESALSRLNQLTAMVPDQAGLAALYRQAHELLLKAAFPNGSKLLYVDLDADGQEEALIYSGDKLGVYRLKPEGIVPLQEPLALKLRQLKADKSPLGQVYLMGELLDGQTIVLGVDQAGLFELMRRDKVDRYELTETGLKLHRVFTQQPPRLMDEEFVIKGREVVALPAEPVVKLELYPDVATADKLIRAYDEALDYSIKEELARLRLSPDALAAVSALASLEQLDQWLQASKDEISKVNVYNYLRESQLYCASITREGETLDIMLHLPDASKPASLRVAGALAGNIPYPEKLDRDVKLPSISYTHDRTERAKAAAHPLNVWMSSTLDDKRREDWYLLTVPEDGGIILSTEHAFYESDRKLFTAALYREGNKEPIWDGYSSAGKSSGSWYEFFLGAGRYQLLVRNERNYDGPQDYRLVAHYLPQLGEVENNNNLNNAQLITLNERWRGQVYGSDDADWFKVELPQNGKITLELDHEYIDSDSYHYKLKWMLNNDTLLYELRSKGPDLTLSSATFFAPQGVNYLRISSDNSHSYRPYGFKVIYEPAENVETEHNSRINRANQVPLNTSFQGSLSVDDDQDFYKFTLPKPGRIILDFSFAKIDSEERYYHLRLYDEMNSEKYITEFSILGSQGAYQRAPFYLPAGDYYLRVAQDYRRSSRIYTLKLNYEEKDNIELEHNDSFTNANLLKPDEAIIGSLISDKDKDSFKLTITEPSEVAFKLIYDVIDKDSNFYKLSFHNAQFEEIWGFPLRGPWGGYNSFSFYLMPGDYYFRVQSHGSFSAAPYNLVYSAKPVAQVEQEPNDSMHSATPIRPGQWMKGSVLHSDDKDFYVFKLDAAISGRLRLKHVHMDSSSNYYGVSLYNANEKRLASFQSPGNQPDLETVDSIDLDPGTYYIRVTGDGGNYLIPYEVSFGP